MIPPFTLVMKADGDPSRHDSIPRFPVFVIPIAFFCTTICLQFIHFSASLFLPLTTRLVDMDGYLKPDSSSA